MVNKISDITDSIENAMRSVGIRYTGVLPEAIDRMGNLYPMGLIMLGTDTTTSENGGVLSQTLMLSVYIVSQHGTAKMRQHCDLLYAALGSVLSSSELDGLSCVRNSETINWSANLPFVSQAIGSLDIISSFDVKIDYMNTR